MDSSTIARRAVKLLGAAAVTGVLSAGVLATAPAAAQTQVSSARHSSFAATHWVHHSSSQFANGLSVSFEANGL